MIELFPLPVNKTKKTISILTAINYHHQIIMATSKFRTCFTIPTTSLCQTSKSHIRRSSAGGLVAVPSEVPSATRRYSVPSSSNINSKKINSMEFIVTPILKRKNAPKTADKPVTSAQSKISHHLDSLIMSYSKPASSKQENIVCFSSSQKSSSSSSSGQFDRCIVVRASKETSLDVMKKTFQALMIGDFSPASKQITKYNHKQYYDYTEDERKRKYTQRKKPEGHGHGEDEGGHDHGSDHFDETGIFSSGGDDFDLKRLFGSNTAAVSSSYSKGEIIAVVMSNNGTLNRMIESGAFSNTNSMGMLSEKVNLNSYKLQNSTILFKTSPSFGFIFDFSSLSLLASKVEKVLVSSFASTSLSSSSFSFNYSSPIQMLKAFLTFYLSLLFSKLFQLSL